MLSPWMSTVALTPSALTICCGRRPVKVFAPNAQLNARLANKMLHITPYSLRPETGFQDWYRILKILYDSATTLAGVEASDELEAKTYESHD